MKDCNVTMRRGFTRVADTGRPGRSWQRLLRIRMGRGSTVCKVRRASPWVGNWVQEGLRGGVEGTSERLRAKKVRFSPRVLTELKWYTQEILDSLMPLYPCLHGTDRLITRLVARLYGLSDEEVGMPCVISLS